MDITANYSLLLDKHQIFLNLNYKMEQSRSEEVTFTMVGFPNDKNGFITSGLGFNKSDYPPTGNESILVGRYRMEFPQRTFYGAG